MFINSISAIGIFAANSVKNADKYSFSPINFKQQMKDGGADEFISTFFNTKMTVDPETQNKILTKVNSENKVVQEVYLDKNDKAIKMIERPENAYVKETFYEDDGKTVKEINEYAPEDETVLLKQLVYNDKKLPVKREFKNGIKVKEVERTNYKDCSAILEYDIIRTFDEKNGNLIEENRNHLLDSCKQLKKFYYDENNKLVKETTDSRDTLETRLFDEEGKLQKFLWHAYSKNEKPEATGNFLRWDVFTDYEYNDDGKLVKEYSYDVRDKKPYSGVKYNPETGKKVVDYDRSPFNGIYSNLYDNDENVVVNRYDKNVIYYDEKTLVPYRFDHKGDDVHSSRIYEPDKKYYAEHKKVNDKKLKSVKYTNFDKYHFDQLIPRFSHDNVKSIAIDYTKNDSLYDTYILEVSKHAPKRSGY